MHACPSLIYFGKASAADCEKFSDTTESFARDLPSAAVSSISWKAASQMSSYMIPCDLSTELSLVPSHPIHSFKVINSRITLQVRTKGQWLLYLICEKYFCKLSGKANLQKLCSSDYPCRQKLCSLKRWSSMCSMHFMQVEDG